VFAEESFAVFARIHKGFYQPQIFSAKITKKVIFPYFYLNYTFYL